MIASRPRHVPDIGMSPWRCHVASAANMSGSAAALPAATAAT